MTGRCVIPCENIKQYAKVIKGLKKAKITFEESFDGAYRYGVLTTSNGKHQNGNTPMESELVTGPVFIINYHA